MKDLRGQRVGVDGDGISLPNPLRFVQSRAKVYEWVERKIAEGADARIALDAADRLVEEREGRFKVPDVIESGEARHEAGDSMAGRDPLGLATRAAGMKHRWVTIDADYRLWEWQEEDVLVLEAVASGALYVAVGGPAGRELYRSVTLGSTKLRRCEVHCVHYKDRVWLLRALRRHMGQSWLLRHQGRGSWAGKVVTPEVEAEATAEEENVTEKNRASVPMAARQPTPHRGRDPYAVQEKARTMKIVERDKVLEVKPYDVLVALMNDGAPIPNEKVGDARLTMTASGDLRVTWTEREETLS